MMNLDSPTPSSLLRVSNAERQRAVDTLKDHYVAGRLTTPELGDRITQALAAQTHGDSTQILGDLPSTSELRPAPDLTAPRGAAAFARASGRAPGLRPARRALAPHVASYTAVMTLLLAIWLLTTPGGYFWPVWPMLGW